MPVINIRFENLPDTAPKMLVHHHLGQKSSADHTPTPIRLGLQTVAKPKRPAEVLLSENNEWTLELTHDGKFWRHPQLQQPTQRAFFYFVWQMGQGQMWVGFRRIKLYLDLIDLSGNSTQLTLNGLDKKGLPACSTAQILSQTGD